MKIAAVQLSGLPGDVRGNLDKIRAAVRVGADALLIKKIRGPRQIIFLLP